MHQVYNNKEEYITEIISSSLDWKQLFVIVGLCRFGITTKLNPITCSALHQFRIASSREINKYFVL